MAPSTTCRLFAGLLVVLWSGRLYANGCFSSIISFGDSIADTGNLKHLASVSDVFFPCVPPYGESFNHQSTGRCSNGRLIIDFLAEILGLPMIPPYFGIKGSGSVVASRQGMNYAVAGSTAIDSSFVEAIASGSVVINGSLGVQLGWFKQSLPSLCGNTTSDCRDYIGRSLILMGEIGGNDYNIPLSKGKSIDDVRSYVPLVIDTIISTINELIEMGAQTLVIPGNFPIGCCPSYLTTIVSEKEGYDPLTGCLTELNEFSEYHNQMLQTKLNQIRELNPNVVVIYADYYNAAMQIYNSPDEYGFTNGALKACCGCGGPYNYNASARCGDASTTLCDEPDKYVSWDGVHLTEAAYKLISKSLFQGPYTTPEFYSLCPRPSTSQGTVGLSSSI
ncbi:putative sinapine esterase [Helianthus annuus]|uniref:Putative SGNH hydrolase-type esterase domain-containing protein n=2 Tax=Helianthus annuus TaxID=4232 RepID=A0A251S6I3_HELAN|nr:GDSL esterase/lipase At1g28590 isoform X1 [Helianthus annuus]KAF5761786.1 putative sinapine esterase [Helianthus annuus]KAJ0439562.1 putative sinapine esterase [Helianthus annuus]KAJ0682978.1 putative sinapine esterase [Helianthus annuus]